MSVVHISEEEAVRDFGSVLARADSGDDVYIDRPGEIIHVSLVTPRLRTAAESLALLRAAPGERGIVDEDFASDVRRSRENQPSSFDPSRWD